MLFINNWLASCSNISNCSCVLEEVSAICKFFIMHVQIHYSLINDNLAP